MENRSFSRYRNLSTLVHKIDPITKLICFIILTTSVFLIESKHDWLFMITMVFVFSLFARVRFKSYFTVLIYLIPFFLLMLFFYWLSIGDIESAAFVVTILTVRMYIFIMIAIIYTSSTKEMDIAYSIEWMITPLKYIKVPTYEISMIIMLAIRFIPLMFEDINLIMTAQTSRGVNVYNGNFITKIKGVASSLLPMLVLAFKRSEDISNAMVIRGYEIGKKRSKYKKNKFGLLEIVSLLIIIMMLTTIIMF